MDHHAQISTWIFWIKNCLYLKHDKKRCKIWDIEWIVRSWNSRDHPKKFWKEVCDANMSLCSKSWRSKTKVISKKSQVDPISTRSSQGQNKFNEVYQLADGYRIQKQSKSVNNNWKRVANSRMHKKRLLHLLIIIVRIIIFAPHKELLQLFSYNTYYVRLIGHRLLWWTLQINLTQHRIRPLKVQGLLRKCWCWRPSLWPQLFADLSF